MGSRRDCGYAGEPSATKRGITSEQMLHSAPKSDGIQVTGVSGSLQRSLQLPGAQVELNIDPVLACPASNIWPCTNAIQPLRSIQTAQVLYAEGKAPADNLLSVVNTASSSSPFEGIADHGIGRWIGSTVTMTAPSPR